MVPKAVDDETIASAATFRQSGRFPVLSYYHKENGVRFLKDVQKVTAIAVGKKLRIFDCLLQTFKEAKARQPVLTEGSHLINCKKN